MTLVVQRRRRIQINKETLSGGSGAYSTVSDDGVVQGGGLSSQFFDFYTIAEATNNFSQKLGEGGFGSVYKVKFPKLIIVYKDIIKPTRYGNFCRASYQVVKKLQ